MNTNQSIGQTQVVVQEAITGAPLKAIKPSHSLQEIQEKLLKIIERNSEWTDPLSRKLREWAYVVLAVPKQTEISLIKKEVDHFLTLLESICVDFTGVPLKDPCLEGDFVWDRANVENYLKISNVSPLTQEELVYKVHTFAKEILLLKEEIEFQTPIDPNAASQGLTLQYFQEKEPESALISYQMLAKITLENSASERRAELLTRLNERVKSLKFDSMSKAQEEKAKVEESIETLKKELEEKIKSLSEAKSAEIELLRNNAKNLEQESKSAKERAKSLEKKAEEFKNQSVHLEQELRNVKAQVNHLEGRLDRGRCTLV